MHMMILLFISLSLFLSSCAGRKAAKMAKVEMEKSAESYANCLQENADNPSNCEAARQLFILRYYQYLLKDEEAFKLRSVTVGTGGNRGSTDSGLSFMCKQAIKNQDAGGIDIYCQ